MSNKNKFTMELVWHNCYDCKNYSLYDVASAGDTCFYKCRYCDRIDRTSFNNKVRYEKCKNFERVD